MVNDFVVARVVHLIGVVLWIGGVSMVTIAGAVAGSHGGWW